MKRHVFFISDGTGLTAEALGASLLSQFENIEFDIQRIPYVNTEEKAQTAKQTIDQVYQNAQTKPLVFATLVNAELYKIINQCQGLMIDLYASFLSPLENELQTPASRTIGRTHGVVDFESYKQRIDAINFALTCDDGAGSQYYDDADVILIGVSRCGKTPTSLYLALQFGVLAANYPLTPDDMDNHQLPKMLQAHRDKLFGLTIQLTRLHSIREERRPDSEYASFTQCRKELLFVEALLQQHAIPYIDTTSYSIEEIATIILSKLGLSRRIQG